MAKLKKLKGKAFAEAATNLAKRMALIRMSSWVEEGLMLRALELLAKARTKTFPYLRRAVSLRRNKDLVKAVDALGDAEVAEFATLMKGVETGKLDPASVLRLNDLMVKAEANLAASVPSLRVIGRMKEHDRLVMAAENLSEVAQRDADHLIEQYLMGNKNPGMGTSHLSGDIYYLRARRGARVFYRENAEGYMEILAKTDKSDEAGVIKMVQTYFGS